MTTSSDYHQPTASKSADQWSGGEHWYELTATLSPESKELFANWIDEELACLEDELNRFVTPNSLKGSRRR